MFMLWVVVFFLISLWGTGMLRRYAIRQNMMDVPNARSSHSLPTPRGGGVAIVVAFLIALVVGALLSGASWWGWGLMGAGLLVAVVGFLDDRGHIAARWRLLAHFSCAAWLLVWMPSLPLLYFAGTGYDLSWVGYGLAALYLVWMLNLYNFMDGIDGIASVQAITTCAAGAWLMMQTGQSDLAMISLTLAACVAGFLWWNFPPARIFMGDAGSGFLGLIIAALGLYAALEAPVLLWSWMILMGVFVVDATVTLLRRLLRGDAVYEAHRSHAYQYAAREVGAHRPVTLAVLLLNVMWLLPWAWAALHGGIDPALGLLVAYAPLFMLAWRFKAGKLEVDD